MAIKFPAQVKVKTATVGTAGYQIDETGISVGYRSITQAVSDGDLANGDQVPYICIDRTVTNGPKLLEVGLGTWNNTTKVLARTVIYQPNGAAISWGSGQRDLVVINNPAMFLLLAGGVMSGLLHVLLSGAAITPNASTGLVVQRSTTAATASGVSVVAGTTGLSGLYLGNTSIERDGGVEYNNSTKTLNFRANNAYGSYMGGDGIFRNSAGTSYLTSGQSVIPAGSVTDWYQAAAPTGWTRITTVNDKVPIIVSAGSPGTVSASTWAINDLTSSLPVHAHDIKYSVAQAGSAGGSGVIDVLGPSGSNTTTTQNAGTGATVSSAGTWRPPGAYMMLASRNAY